MFGSVRLLAAAGRENFPQRVKYGYSPLFSDRGKVCNDCTLLRKRFTIIRNAIRCKKCGDIVESTSVHGFKTCSADGGHDYLRRSAPSVGGFINLSMVWNVISVVAGCELVTTLVVESSEGQNRLKKHSNI